MCYAIEIVLLRNQTANDGNVTVSVSCIKGVVNCQNSRDKEKAIVPVGKPRPYSIIILNMRFIPKASLRESSQITASSYILERHL